MSWGNRGCKGVKKLSETLGKLHNLFSPKEDVKNKRYGTGGAPKCPGGTGVHTKKFIQGK